MIVKNRKKSWKLNNYGKAIKELNNNTNKYSKLAQKEYKTRHNWVSKVIDWELCKKLKSCLTTKWYMHKSESTQEKETHKSLWDFEVQTDHRIPVRKPKSLMMNEKKRTIRTEAFAVLADDWVKIKENEERKTSTWTLLEN